MDLNICLTVTSYSSLLNLSFSHTKTVLLQRWLLIVDVTVRTILQRTAINFGNTSRFKSDLHRFFTVREVDLIVLRAL